MKKTLLFTMIALLGMTQAVAEEYEYMPFVREGVSQVGVLFCRCPHIRWDGIHYIGTEGGHGD